MNFMNSAPETLPFLSLSISRSNCTVLYSPFSCGAALYGAALCSAAHTAAISSTNGTMTVGFLIMRLLFYLRYSSMLVPYHECYPSGCHNIPFAFTRMAPTLLPTSVLKLGSTVFMESPCLRLR